MAYSVHPTVITGQTWTASNQNTFVRDNFAALWPYTAAGDLAYANAPNTLARLGKGTAFQVLRMNSGATAPEWATSTGLHTRSQINFNPAGQSTTGTAFVDITGASVNLTLTTACTVLVFAVVTGYHNTAGRSFSVRAVVDGTADPAAIHIFNGAEVRNEALPYIYQVTGIPAGTRNVRMQFSGDASGTAFVERGRLIAIAFAE